MPTVALIRGLVALFAMLTKADPIPDLPFVATASTAGRDSSVSLAKVSLATDKAAFRQLWAEHRGTSGATLPSNVQIVDDFPKVDFTENVVLMIFGGTTENVDGYAVVGTEAVNQKAFVRLSPILMPSGGATMVTMPYGLVVLPRTRFPIEIQYGSEGDGWRTIAKFPATHLTPKVAAS